MLREQAIQMCMEIKDYLTQGNPIWDKDKVGEAIDMAMEALKREDTMLKEIERVVLYGERSEECKTNRNSSRAF